MKKLLSFFISVTMILSVFPQIIFAENNENLLSDASFESGVLSGENSWKFTGGVNWYGYGTAGKFGIETDIVNSADGFSVMLEDGMVGQRVYLESGKRYKLSAQIYSTAANSSINIGFYDGTKQWPASNEVKVFGKTLDQSGEWRATSVIFECTQSREYIVGFWGLKTPVYIDDIILCETDELPEASPTPTPVPTPSIIDEPAEDYNLIKNSGFENGTLSDENSWKFTQQRIWYGYGTQGKVDVNNTIIHTGDFSACVCDGMIGQRVSLSAGKTYNLQFYIYPESGGTNISFGFYDGTSTYPASSNVEVIEKELDWSGEWRAVSLQFKCESSKDYIVGFFETEANVYIDDVILSQSSEAQSERIFIQDKKILDNKLIYNVGILSGTSGDLITAVFDDDGRCVYINSEESKQLQNISIPLEDMSSGTTRFYLWNSVGGMIPLSLPAEDIWENKQPESAITLNYNTYPLYVGNASTTDFSSWDGYGSSFTLEAAVESEKYSEADIIWTISDDSIASLSTDKKNKATVLGRRTGYAIATATLPDGSNTSCLITVLDNYNRLQTQRIELNINSIKLAKGESAEIVPIFYPKDIYNNGMLDTSISYATSNADVAVVSKGKITAVGNGTATITVKSLDVGRVGVCTVTVTDSVSAHGITAASNDIIDMTVGETLKLEADVDGESGIVWQSDNSNIADVDKNGLVRAYSNSYIQSVSDDGLTVTEEKGTVKIYATTTEGGYMTEYTLHISDAPVEVQKVSLNKNNISMPKGSTQSITAAVSPANIIDSKITWESSNSDIISVEETEDTIYGVRQAVITAVGTGTAEISAVSNGKCDTCTVTVTDETVNIDNIEMENSKEIDIDEIYKFTPTVNSDAADKKLIWICTDESVATVDRDGNVMGYKAGTAEIYAIAADSLQSDEQQALEELSYSTKTIGNDNSILQSALESAVYAKCVLTVNGDETYLRNVHIPQETITDNSVNILWNRASLLDANNLKEYQIYCDDEYISSTTQLGYTVENLEPSCEYTFEIHAVDMNGDIIEQKNITAKTKEKTEIINVLEAPYNAKGDGLVTDTYAIQRAINDCPDGGTVWLPGGGHIYYSGALFLKDNMTLKVDGVLLGSIDPKDYPHRITRWEGWRKTEQTADEWDNTTESLPENHCPHAGLINIGTYDESENVYNAHNITICGDGEINGNGFALSYNEGPNYAVAGERYPFPVKDPTLRGRTISVQNAQNIYIKDVLVSYSPSWTIHTIYSDNVTFDNVSVISQGNGNVGHGTSGVNNMGHIYNGDGIDIDSCTNVNVFDSYFKTGDDVVILKSGRNKEGSDLGRPNAYVRVTDCFAEYCVGAFGSGSENSGGDHDILFQNIRTENLRYYGFWLKTTKARGGITEDIQVRDFECNNSNAAVYIDYNYSSASTNPSDSIHETRYITFENVGGNVWNYGYRINGLSNMRVSDLVIRGATFDAESHCELKYCDNVRITDCINTSWNESNTSNVVYE